jgi:hypothetical protein
MANAEQFALVLRSFDFGGGPPSSSGSGPVVPTKRMGMGMGASRQTGLSFVPKLNWSSFSFMPPAAGWVSFLFFVFFFEKRWWWKVI